MSEVFTEETQSVRITDLARWFDQLAIRIRACEARLMALEARLDAPRPSFERPA